MESASAAVKGLKDAEDIQRQEIVTNSSEVFH